MIMNRVSCSNTSIFLLNSKFQNMFTDNNNAFIFFFHIITITVEYDCSKCQTLNQSCILWESQGTRLPLSQVGFDKFFGVAVTLLSCLKMCICKS